MGIRERWQELKEKLNEEFNPGLKGDPIKISYLQSGLGATGIDGYAEVTPPYGTPAITTEMSGEKEK